MDVPPFDLNRIVRRTVQILGGTDAFRAATDEEFEEIQARWNQNVDSIGRILRAHLFVEHYLTEHLSHANPALGSPKDARLSFAQKVALLNPNDPDIADVLAGLKHLNAIRNRLAHNLASHVTEADAALLLRSARFDALRRARGGKVSSEPMAVLEDFARHVGMVFSYGRSKVSAALSQAIAESKLPEKAR